MSFATASIRRPIRATRALLVVLPLVGAGIASAAGADAGAVQSVIVPSLDSAPAGVAVGPGGAIWFVENTGGAVGSVDTSGHVTEFPVPADSAGLLGAFDSITEGPDGAMWFTDASTFNPRIGRIDPSSGAVTTYELPTTGTPSFAGAEPLRIVTGPDGALWFSAGPVVGRITTSGQSRAFPTPNGGFVRGVTVGPDHAIWFTETTPDAIGRIDPATGHVTVHALPSTLGNLAPAGITTGPDHGLWFTESGVSRIGRLDVTTGQVVTVATPTANAVPLDIIPGAASALWFTEAGAGNIARIDLTRHITEYPLATNLVAPLQVARTAAGSLWIAEAGVDRLAQVSLNAPPVGPANRSLVTTAQAPAAYEYQCPVNRLCTTQVTTGGVFKIKNFAQALPAGAIRLTGYFVAAPSGLALKPPLSGQELVSKPVAVQGGLLGAFPLLGPIVGPLAGPANNLSITLSLAGQVTVSFDTALHATVPVTLHLHNSTLGSNCTIGPVVQHLLVTPTSAGTADPAMNWTPQASVGTDGTFGVPGAQGCGSVPTVFDAVIDQQLGLPSASGNNSVVLPSILSTGLGVHP